MKIVVVAVLLLILGFLFISSVERTRSAPYTVDAAALEGWRVTLDPAAASPTAPLLSLTGRPDLVSGLFRQVFTRAMESLVQPAGASIPLVLKGEFDNVIAAAMTADELLSFARNAGLEAVRYEPRCLAHRRISEPGVIRQVYFAVFVAKEFERFRQQLGDRLASDIGPGSGFNPTLLTPVMFVAGGDAAFHRWLPIRADPFVDCVAPIEAG